MCKGCDSDSANGFKVHGFRCGFGVVKPLAFQLSSVVT